MLVRVRKSPREYAHVLRRVRKANRGRDMQKFRLAVLSNGQRKEFEGPLKIEPTITPGRFGILPECCRS